MRVPLHASATDCPLPKFGIVCSNDRPPSDPMEEIESCFSLPYRRTLTRATVVPHRAFGIGNGVATADGQALRWVSSGLGSRRSREHFGTGTRDVGVGRLAAGHERIAALLDDAAAFPRARFGEFGDLGRSIALRPILRRADRRQRHHDGVVRGRCRILAGGAAGHPATPAETDDHAGHGTDDGAPHHGLSIRWKLHGKSFQGRSAAVRSCTRHRGADDQQEKKSGNRTGGYEPVAHGSVGPARRVQSSSWDSLSRIPFTSACLVRCLRRVLTEEWYSSETRVFATKGSDLGKTSFGDGASLLGSLDAAVNADVIVLDWGLPKISGIDILVNAPGLAQFLAAHATLGRNAG